MKRITLLLLILITFLQSLPLFSAEKIDLSALAGKSLNVIKAKFPSGHHEHGGTRYRMPRSDFYTVYPWRGMTEINFYFVYDHLTDVYIEAPFGKNVGFKEFSAFLHDNLGIDLIESPEKPFYYNGQGWNASYKDYLKKIPKIFSTGTLSLLEQVLEQGKKKSIT